MNILNVNKIFDFIKMRFTKLSNKKIKIKYRTQKEENISIYL